MIDNVKNIMQDDLVMMAPAVFLFGSRDRVALGKKAAGTSL